MTPSFNSIAQAAIMACYSDHYAARDLNAGEAADELVAASAELNKEAVVDALHHGFRKKKKQIRDDVIEAALKILKRDSEDVVRRYKHPETRLFVTSLLDLGPAQSAQELCAEVGDGMKG